MDLNQGSLFESFNIWIDIFAEKKLCAFHPREREMLLVRKEQKKFDRLVEDIIKPLLSQELSNTTIQEAFGLLGQVLSELEKALKDNYPKDGPIQFGSFGLEGLTQLGQVEEVQQKYEELISKDALAMIDKLKGLSSMNELLEDSKFNL